MATATLYVQSVNTPAGNFDSGTGGPLGMTIGHTGNPQYDRTGDDEYPRFVALTDKEGTCEITIRDNYYTGAIGATTGDIAFTWTAGAHTRTGTLKTMMLISVRPSQERATYGQMVLGFTHVSGDGKTIPLA